MVRLASAQEPFTAGTWSATSTPPPSAVAHAVLLTDGSVLVNSFFFSHHADPWYRLVPDATGSYIHGTWKNAGTLPTGYNPLYFASSVLPNGQVVVMGGEYNNSEFSLDHAWRSLQPGERTNGPASLRLQVGRRSVMRKASILPMAR